MINALSVMSVEAGLGPMADSLCGKVSLSGLPRGGLLVVPCSWLFVRDVKGYD